MRFRITWREGAYYVSVPEYEGGEVVTIDEFENLERSWQIEAQAAHDREIECERLRADLVTAAQALAEASTELDAVGEQRASLYAAERAKAAWATAIASEDKHER